MSCRARERGSGPSLLLRVLILLLISRRCAILLGEEVDVGGVGSLIDEDELLQVTPRAEVLAPLRRDHFLSACSLGGLEAGPARTALFRAARSYSVRWQSCVSALLARDQVWLAGLFLEGHVHFILAAADAARAEPRAASPLELLIQGLLHSAHILGW